MGGRARPRGEHPPGRDRGVESQDAQVGVEIDFDFTGFGARLRDAGCSWGAFVLRTDRTSSTNDLALAYARHAAPEGSVFLAREQTAGRGRHNRRWESSPGGLYMSVLLRPRAADPTHLLPHLVSIAVAEVLRSDHLVDATLRWPNDVYLDDRKLGGILCEGSYSGESPSAFVAGIGVNVAQSSASLSAEVRARAAFLPASVSVDGLALSILSRLETWWRKRDPAAIVARWSELAEGERGRLVRVHPSEGVAYEAETEGMQPDGALAVRLADGERRTLYADEVEYLRDDAFAEESYYGMIESHFVERRGGPLFITPAEWALIQRWEQDEVPLEVVRAGIDAVFDRPRTARRPRKLTYCRQTVEALHRRHREAVLGGRPGPVNEEASGARDHLRALAEVVAEHSPHTATVLSELADGERSPAGIESELEALDAALLDEAERGVEPAVREDIEREAADSLERYRERMPDDVYGSALRSAYRRRLRRRLGLPRLSLFDR